MTTLSFKVSDDLAARLDALAKHSHVSRSELVRDALIEKLQKAEKKNRPSLLEQCSDLCGSGESGMGDLSSNPDHMEGFGS